MMKRAALLLLLVPTAPTAIIAMPPIQTGASLVADIAPGPAGDAAAGSAPRQLVTASGRTLFFTGGGESDNPYDYSARLWSTDGTESGTDLLAVLCSPPLSCSFGPHMLGSLDGLGLAVFQVDSGDGTYMVRLWRSNGTRSGTYPIAGPFYPGSRFVHFGGLYYFTACGPDACSLWHTDGTATGTAPGRPAGSDSIVVLKGRLFYLSSAPRSALWVSDGRDGTSEGTRLVRELPQGSGGLLTVAGNRLYFMAGQNASELWTSDGTKAGTRYVKTFSPIDDDGYGGTGFLKPWGERVLFLGNPSSSRVSNLWVSDGTSKGTRRLTRFSGFDVSGLWENQIAILRDRAFFVAGGVSGPRLWSTRGTPATTAPVTGCPGGCPSLSSLAPLVPLGTRLLLPGIDGLRITDGTGPATLRLHTGPVTDLVPAGGLVYFASGASLWRTDGTATGTVRLGGIGTAPPRYGRLDLAPLGTRVVFAGSDPVHGEQPWITDGTPDGTTLVANLGGAAASSMPADFTSLGTALGGRLLFTAEDGSTRSVWSSDGTPAGTLALAGADLDSPPPAGLVRAGSLGFFAHDAGTRFDLWRTDGTAAGTFVVAEFPDRAIQRLSEVGGRLVALVSSTLGERPVHALWTSDGTPAGTRKLLELPDDTVTVGSWIPLGPELFFTAARERRLDLYRSDGTPEGTRAILALDCAECPIDSNPIEAVRGGDGKAVLLVWGLNDAGRNLWRTDGTPEGTAALLSIPADGSGRIYAPMAPSALGNDILFFAASPEVDDFTRWAFWRLRGSDLTLLSKAGTAGYEIQSPAVDDGHGHLVFSAWDRDHGRELWRTDGTLGGTVLLADIVPGPGSSNPEGLTFAGGQAVFSAQDGVHGREIWTTDGTAAGTRLLEDLAPGGVSSSPRGFTAAGGLLFFSADDGTTGREPWVRPLPF
jgi:ELWxxDGT repeat protein